MLRPSYQGKLHLAAEKSAPAWIPKICTGLGLLRTVLLSLVISCLLGVLRYGLAGLSAVNFGPLALLVLWLILLCAFWLCLLHPYQTKWRQPLVAGLALGGILLVVALASGLFNLWLSWVQPAAAPSMASPLENVFIALLFAAVILRFFAVQAQLQLSDQQLNRARFDALQPAQAEDALLDLSDMLRSSVGRERSDWTLADEIDICLKYLGIEKLRMGERLNWHIELADAARPIRFPQLALQPLVENSVLHGLQHLPEGGDLHLELALQDDRLSITLSNSLAPTSASSPGLGEALANIRARLVSYTPKLHAFEYGQEGSHYLVRIVLEVPR